MKRKPDTKEQSRSRESRRRIIDAVVRIVSKRGFSGVTIANIVKESGLSSGVIQYQFGGKNKVFKAVVDDSTRQLQESLSAPGEGIQDLESALEFVIQTLWMYYSKPYYRATLEILLNASSTSSDLRASVSNTKELITTAWQERLQPYCPSLTRDDVAGIVAIAVATLRGLAIGEAILVSKTTQRMLPEKELQSLRKMLMVYLQASRD